MLRDAQGKAALAHRRPTGDDDEIRRLQSCELLIQLHKAGGQPRDRAFALIERVDHLDRAFDDVLHRDRVALELLRGDVKDQGFRAVEQQVGFLRLLVAFAGDVGRGANERAEDGFLLDDAAVILGIGRGRDDGRQRRQVAGSADFFEQVALFQRLRDRDEIDGRIGLVERQEGREDVPVGVFIEHGVVEQLRRVDEGFFLDEHRAEDGLLRLKVLGRHPLKRGQDVRAHCHRKLSTTARIGPCRLRDPAVRPRYRAAVQPTPSATGSCGRAAGTPLRRHPLPMELDRFFVN